MSATSSPRESSVLTPQLEQLTAIHSSSVSAVTTKRTEELTKPISTERISSPIDLLVLTLLFGVTLVAKLILKYSLLYATNDQPRAHKILGR